MGKKEIILESAIELFNSSNLKAVTTNHIAKAINISPGNLYYHYSNKEEIIYDIFNMFMDSHLELCLKYREIDDIKEMSSFYDCYFDLVWDYRFLLRESYYLCSVDERLNGLFLRYRKVEVEEIINTTKSFRNKKLIPHLSDEDIEKHSKLISIMLNNLICYNHPESKDQWNKTCQQYKELLFFMVTRR